jgi:hypothetical protein
MGLSHLRIIFPLETDIPNVVRLDRDENYPIVAKVWHKVVHWDDMQPAYDHEMEIHVGVERKPEEDLFGKLTVPPAQGLIRGAYLGFEQPVAGSPWGWLVLLPRYDMQEGPEIWTADWHATLSSDEPGSYPFCYKLEINHTED